MNWTRQIRVTNLEGTVFVCEHFLCKKFIHFQLGNLFQAVKDYTVLRNNSTTSGSNWVPEQRMIS